MAVFEEFKAKVKEIRNGLDDFKTKHEMEDREISTLIESLPPYFNKFGGIIWNSLEKQDDSDRKMLRMLERIAENIEAAFMHIMT